MKYFGDGYQMLYTGKQLDGMEVVEVARYIRRDYGSNKSNICCEAKYDVCICIIICINES